MTCVIPDPVTRRVRRREALFREQTVREQPKAVAGRRGQAGGVEVEGRVLAACGVALHAAGVGGGVEDAVAAGYRAHPAE